MRARLSKHWQTGAHPSFQLFCGVTFILGRDLSEDRLSFDRLIPSKLYATIFVAMFVFHEHPCVFKENCLSSRSDFSPKLQRILIWGKSVKGGNGVKVRRSKRKVQGRCFRFHVSGLRLELWHVSETETEAVRGA